MPTDRINRTPPNRSGASFILSGGADGDIRLWGAGNISKFTKASENRVTVDDEEELGRYECKRRLAGHYRSATCVSYGRLELVSGHEDGEGQVSRQYSHCRAAGGRCR